MSLSTFAASPVMPHRVAAGGLWWLHGLLLAFAIGVVATAAVLELEPDHHVQVPVVGITLPELCSWRRLFGMGCPGCGLTRCFVSLAHAYLAQAWHFNPVGILLFGAVLFQVPYRLLQMARLSRGRPELQLPALPECLLAVCVLLLLQWVVRELL